MSKEDCIGCDFRFQCPIVGQGTCGDGGGDEGKPAQVNLIQPEEILLYDYRTGSESWGKHKKGELSNIDGRTSRKPVLRSSRQKTALIDAAMNVAYLKDDGNIGL